LLFGSIYQHLLFLQIARQLSLRESLRDFVVKNNAVQYRSLRWEKSHEVVMKMLRVEKAGAHAAC